MNLFEVLIILLFIVFPLLQQVLGSRKEEDAPDLEGNGEAGERLGDLAPPRDRAPMEDTGRGGRPPGARRQGTAGPAGEAPGGWSADWGEWPAGSDEEEPEEWIEERPAVTREAGTLPADSPALPAPESEREVVRTPTRVVSLEDLHVDRAAEHERFHARTDRPLPAAKQPAPRLAALLRHRGDLRHAILLAEVVGPPAALRGDPGPLQPG